MTRFLRRWRQRLTGPIGRRLLLALALTAAWLAWLILPPRPLREWATVSAEPRDWLLTPDRTRLACVTARYVKTLQPGRSIKGAAEYGAVRVWDLATGRERLTDGAGQPTNTPVTLRVAPDGSWLLVTRQIDRPEEVALQLWDTATGRERWSTPILNHETGQLRATSVASPNGRYIACRRSNGTGDVLLTATGQVQFTLGNAWPLAFAPDSQTLVTAEPPDGGDVPTTVTLWDLPTGRLRCRLTFRERTPCVAALSPDGHKLAVGLCPEPPDQNAPLIAELRDLRAGGRIAEWDALPNFNWQDVRNALEFRLVGTMLVASSPFDEGVYHAWDIAQTPPRVVDIQDASVKGSRGARLLMSTHRDPPLYPILLAPDGTRFMGPGLEEGTWAFWETAAPDRAILSNKKVPLIELPAVAPDGRTLAGITSPSFLPVWLEAINQLYQAIGRPGPCYLVDERRAIAFFDATTGMVYGQIDDLPADTHLIGFGPDGRTVWTMTHVLNPPSPPPPPNAPLWNYLPDMIGDGTLRLQEWAVPTGWPSPWLVALTALGLPLAVVDWRRSRRRAMARGEQS
jgi:hypothetical protein